MKKKGKSASAGENIKGIFASGKLGRMSQRGKPLLYARCRCYEIMKAVGGEV